MTCSLIELVIDLGWPACAYRDHLHHVLNKSFLAGNKQALALVEGKYKHLFMVPVCGFHNCDRYADTKIARAYLLMLHAREIVEPALEEIAKCYKGGYSELQYGGLMEPYRKYANGALGWAPMFEDSG